MGKEMLPRLWLSTMSKEDSVEQCDKSCCVGAITVRGAVECGNGGSEVRQLAALMFVKFPGWKRRTLASMGPMTLCVHGNFTCPRAHKSPS